jgi:PAX-interacting protein 1
MEEIQEINQQLIDTELHVSKDDTESSALHLRGLKGQSLYARSLLFLLAPA